MSFQPNFFRKFEFKLIIILILYVLTGIFLLKFFQYQINGDAIAYIKIAKTYFIGDWYGAVESYHSPMISWLLIPFLLFSNKPTYALYATKILSLFVGFFTIIGISLLSTRFDLNNKLRVVVLILLIPITLYFAYSAITPDLLLICFLVYYFYFIFDPDYQNKLSSPLLCGILGSMAYLTKSYAFPFTIAHFFIFNIFHYLKNKSNWKNVIRNLIMGFVVFFIISGLWMGVMSVKEGNFTYGSAGDFNHDLVGPGAKGWLTVYLGESPVDVQDWSAFESLAYFKYQLGLIWKNIQQTVSIFNTFSYFALIIIISYVILIIKPVNKILKDQKVLFPLATLVIYVAGYTPILVEERYLWVAYILLLLMGAYILTLIFKNEFFTPTRKTILTLFFAVSFVILPVNYLVNNMNTDMEVYLLSESINNLPEHSKIASNNEWLKSSYLSYYWEGEYIGQSKPFSNQKELINILKSHETDYYLVWGDNNFNSSGYKEITGGKIKGLVIYDMRS